MGRREFVARLGGAMLAWPLAARGQRASMPYIGYLSSGSPNERAHMVESFRRGLKEGGYVDGKDVAIEYRWGEERLDRSSRLAAELVERKVAVIVTSGGGAVAQAAKAATSTIPIVFITSQDPVKLGLIGSFARPGGNVTGVANVASTLDAKRMQILRELVPGLRSIAYLINPDAAGTKLSLKEVLAAAEATGTKVHIFEATNREEITAAFAAIKESGAGALLVATAGLFTTRRDQVVALAARHAIPASYSRREFAVGGGLMSYGPDYADVYRQAGLYTSRILKGAKPADLPVIQTSKFELVVNLKTARKLGLTVSRDFLARVDEIVE